MITHRILSGIGYFKGRCCVTQQTDVPNAPEEQAAERLVPAGAQPLNDRKEESIRAHVESQ